MTESSLTVGSWVLVSQYISHYFSNSLGIIENTNTFPIVLTLRPFDSRFCSKVSWHDSVLLHHLEKAFSAQKRKQGNDFLLVKVTSLSEAAGILTTSPHIQKNTKPGSAEAPKTIQKDPKRFKKIYIKTSKNTLYRSRAVSMFFFVVSNHVHLLISRADRGSSLSRSVDFPRGITPRKPRGF